MKALKHTNTALLMALVALSTTACDKMVGLSDSAQSVTKKAFNDTKTSWSDMFTYHPKSPPPLPQTRYCYQMQSDVVCYDSEQPTLTAKLIGYQEGDHMSWVQPGGGSLGASGGEPIALRPPAAPRMQVGNNSFNATQPKVVYSNGNASTGVSLPTSNVPKTTGEISIDTLPIASPRNVNKLN